MSASPPTTTQPAEGRAMLARDILMGRQFRPRFSPGNALRLLQNGEELFPALEQAVANARRIVLLETYIYNDDEAARRITAALCAAAARGVQVFVVVDGFGTHSLADEVRDTLLRSGVHVATFRPERGLVYPDRRRLRRLHRKLTVVDGEIGFIGGINLIDDWIDPNHGALEQPRLDYAVRLQGPVVHDIGAAMRRLWFEPGLVREVERGGRRQPDKHWPAPFEPVTVRLSPDADEGDVGAVTGTHPDHPDIRGRAMLALRDNLRFRRTIERHYLRAIGHARREVLIANAYFFPGSKFRRALLNAAGRGVKVRLLLQGRVEYRLQHYASQALYDELLRAGIEIVEYRSSFMHAKVAVIDDWVTVGSSNIDPFSLLLAREANLIVVAPAFASLLRERLNLAITQGGVAVALKHHARRPWPIRILNRVAFFLLRVAVAISGARRKY